MTIKAIKEAYKNYRAEKGGKNMFATYDFGGDLGKVVVIVNNDARYGKTVLQGIRVADGAKLLSDDRARACDSLDDAIDVFQEMLSNR